MYITPINEIPRQYRGNLYNKIVIQALHNFLVFIRICPVGLFYQAISPTLPTVHFILQGIPLYDQGFFLGCQISLGGLERINTAL